MSCLGLLSVIVLGVAGFGGAATTVRQRCPVRIALTPGRGGQVAASEEGGNQTGNAGDRDEHEKSQRERSEDGACQGSQ
jgi:hypothetical protein